ncbi:MAG: hypothetical protein JWM74_2475 [Myxococcaceae bacterium]|nr:hypothetical protein [Myxococcaceae bacterium]
MQARRDEALVARVLSRRELYYATGPHDQLDRPAFVRSGSGAAWVGKELAIIQDDANFIALVDPETCAVRDVTLPADLDGRRQFDDERGNKARKLDLEACFSLESDDGLETRLIGLGSGSTEMRERIVTLRFSCRDSRDTPEDPVIRVTNASSLYAALRARTEFSGSELNIEGVVVLGNVLRLFQRGNGAPHGALEPVDATCDLDLEKFLAYLANPQHVAPPEITNVVAYELGKVAGSRLTFTDACGTLAGSTLYLAAAEDSPDVTRDGPVAGLAVGVIDAHEARYTLLVDAEGKPLKDKAEGIALVRDAEGMAYVVVDPDSPHAPCTLMTIELTGAW